MQIIALQEYSDKYISLYEGEIRNIEENLANRLIEEKIVAEHGDSSDSEKSSIGNGINTLYFLNFEKEVNEAILHFYGFFQKKLYKEITEIMEMDIISIEAFLANHSNDFITQEGEGEIIFMPASSITGNDLINLLKYDINFVLVHTITWEGNEDKSYLILNPFYDSDEQNNIIFYSYLIYDDATQYSFQYNTTTGRWSIEN